MRDLSTAVPQAFLKKFATENLDGAKDRVSEFLEYSNQFKTPYERFADLFGTATDEAKSELVCSFAALGRALRQANFNTDARDTEFFAFGAWLQRRYQREGKVK